MSNIADVEMLSGRFQMVGSEISMALYAAILRAEAAEKALGKIVRAASNYIEHNDEPMYVHMLDGKDCEGECGAALGEAIGAYQNPSKAGQE